MNITAPVTANSESDDIARLRIAFAELENVIEETTAYGRRQALALTYLEISSMYAYKAAYERADEPHQEILDD